MPIGILRRLLVTLFVLALVNGSPVWSAPPESSRLADLVAQARRSFAPVGQPEQLAARKALEAAFADIETYLKDNGENGTAWREHLLGDYLAQQLSPGAELNLPVLEEIHRRYTSGHEGLELPEFTRVATTLRRFIDLASLGSAKEQQTDFESHLGLLVEVSPVLAKQATAADVARLEEALAALERSGAAPQVTSHVRAQHSQPNLMFQATSTFVGLGIERQVDETTPIRQNQGKARITGSGRTVGRLAAETEADGARGVIHTLMTGDLHLNAVAVSGPAVVCTRGHADLWGRKTLYLDETGFRITAANSKIDLCHGVSGVGSTKCGVVDKIVKRVASRKAPGEVAKNYGSTLARVRSMFEKRLNDEGDRLVTEANDNYQRKFRMPLVRFQAFPRLFKFHTTPESLGLTVAHDPRGRIAAPTPAPPLDTRVAMGLRLHESFVNNLMHSMLSGRKLTKDDVERILITQTGKVPDAFKDDPNADEDEKGPWSITFAARDPVTLRVDDNLLTIVIRGTRFSSGGKNYDAMNVTARYRVEHAGNTLRATRVADLEIIPPDFKPGTGQTLNSRQTILRNLLQKRLAKLFEPELKSEGLKLGGGYEKLGPLEPRQWVAERGWLVVGWSLPEKATPLAETSSSTVSAAE